jgi:UDP-N-acetylglucosamine--dolichyl-phosphate N-acetylglucosaminephosphotransferase
MVSLGTLDFNSILITAVISAVAFSTTMIIMPILIRKLKKADITGIDYHKLAKPKIPEMGGIGIVTTMLIGNAMAYILLPEVARGILSAALMVATGALIGLLDDFKRLGAKTKPVLTAIACWPVFLLQTYSPFPIFPFIGKTRLPIFYPLLIPLGTAIAANGVNMLDVLNGAMPSACVPVSFALLICSIILGSMEGMVLSAILTSVLLAYYVFNRYPAKVFDGDTGSLAVGTMIAAIAIIGRLEVVAIIAAIPFIMNSFHSLASIGRLFERREIRQRPTFLRNDEKIAANTDARAPLTLTRILVASTPLRENEVVRSLFVLSVFSSVLAIITVILFF